MESLQVRKVVGRQEKIDLAGGDLGKLLLSLREQRIVPDVQSVAQRETAWVAVRILSSAILVQCQAGLR